MGTKKPSRSSLCRRLFSLPELLLRRLFVTVAVRVSAAARPKAVIALFLLSHGVLFGLSFLRSDFTVSPIYRAYQPTSYLRVEHLYKSIANFHTQHTQHGAFNQSHSSDLESVQLLIFLYDIRIDSYEKTFEFLEETNKVCQFILNYTYDGRNYTELCGSFCHTRTLEFCRFAAKTDEPMFEFGKQLLAVQEFSASRVMRFVKANLSPGLASTFEDDRLPAYLYLSFVVPKADAGARGWTRDIVQELHVLVETRVRQGAVRVALASQEYSALEERLLIEEEALKLVGCCLVTVLVAVVATVNCWAWRFSRALLALAAVLMSLLAIAAGFALGHLLGGLPLFSILLFIPFLIIGIGIDSSFLLMHQWLTTIDHYSRQPAAAHLMTVEGIVAATVEGCFLSVTLSDVTAVVAFGIGTQTPFLAVNTCCKYLALCVTCLWMGEMFFFLPCLAIKTRRFLAGTPHLCKTVSACHERAGPTGEERQAPEKPPRQDAVFFTEVLLNPPEATEPAVHDGQEDGRPPADGAARHLFNPYERGVMWLCASVTRSDALRLSWIALFLAITGFSCYGLATMRAEESRVDFYSDSSVTRQFHLMTSRHENHSTASTNVMLRVPATLDGRGTFARDMRRLRTSLEAADRLLPRDENDFDWLTCFQREYNLSSSWEHILQVCPARNDLASDRREKHLMFPAVRRATAPGHTEEEARILERIRSLEEQYESLGLKLFDYNLPLMSRNALIKPSLWASVGVAGICCVVTVSIFIPQLTLIVAIVLMTGVTFVNTLGCMSWAGLTYSSQTLVMALIAMGMSIDYVAHSGRAFFHHWRLPPPVRRLRTVHEISVPLVNSALSSLLGVSLLALAATQSLRDVATGVSLTFAHALFNSVLVLPNVLFYLTRCCCCSGGES